MKPIKFILFAGILSALGCVLAPTATAMDHAHHASTSVDTPAVPVVSLVSDVVKDCSGGHCPDCFVPHTMSMCSFCTAHDGDQRHQAILPIGFHQEIVDLPFLVGQIPSSPPPFRIGNFQKLPIPPSYSGLIALRL